MRIATHDGTFHADEVFAIAALSLLGASLDVVRTRKRELLATADLRVDIGFAFDPANGDFDHHQREFEERRANGIGYASFGLVWREYGARLCDGDEEVAAQIDELLAQGIDANDTGQSLTEAVIEGARPMTVSDVVAGFNARWDETLTDAQERERFDAAVALAAGILEREIASAAAGRRATRLVLDAIGKAPDPRVVELSENVPWKSVLVPEAPDALYVIYPKRQGFGLEAVPQRLGAFENRRDLPAAWGGLEGDDLAALTGVGDALFCHVKRFLVVAGSRVGIGALAEQALAED